VHKQTRAMSEDACHTPYLRYFDEGAQHEATGPNCYDILRLNYKLLT
jgi:hypothetical protein